MESLVKFEGMFENGVSWKDCCNCVGKICIWYLFYIIYIMKYIYICVYIYKYYWVYFDKM